LKPETAAWWRSVVRDFELEEHHERLLTLAGEAWDRAEEARKVTEREGSYYVNRFSEPRSHPAVTVERDARAQFARILRELDLPDPNDG
jgi:phage terminase small subunit